MGLSGLKWLWGHTIFYWPVVSNQDILKQFLNFWFANHTNQRVVHKLQVYRRNPNWFHLNSSPSFFKPTFWIIKIIFIVSNQDNLKQFLNFWLANHTNQRVAHKLQVICKNPNGFQLNSSQWIFKPTIWIIKIIFIALAGNFCTNSTSRLQKCDFWCKQFGKKVSFMNLNDGRRSKS